MTVPTTTTTLMGKIGINASKEESNVTNSIQTMTIALMTVVTAFLFFIIFVVIYFVWLRRRRLVLKKRKTSTIDGEEIE